MKNLIAILSILFAAPAIAGFMGGGNATALRGIPLTTTVPLSGQSIVYNGSAWAPGSGGGGGAVAPLTLTGSTDAIQLNVIANATQTNPLLQLTASDGTTPLWSVDPSGNIYAPNGDGTSLPAAYSFSSDPNTGMSFNPSSFGVQFTADGDLTAILSYTGNNFFFPVTINPTSSTSQADAIQLNVVATSGQSSKVFQISGSDGTTNLFNVDAGGRIIAANAASFGGALQVSYTGAAGGGNPLASLTNGVDATLNIMTPTSGQVRFATDSTGRFLSFADGAGTTDTLILQNGSVMMPTLASSSSATTGSVCWTTSTGNLTVDTTVACLSSTRKVKQDIEDLPSGIDTVMKLRPVSFQRKAPAPIGREVGFIAEEVADVDPRLVGFDSSGEPKGVRYMEYTAVLTRALQEQQAQIESLREEIRLLRFDRSSVIVPVRQQATTAGTSRSDKSGPAGRGCD